MKKIGMALMTSLIVVAFLVANILPSFAYLPGTPYTWDPSVPNYNPSATIHTGTIDTSLLVMGDFLGVSPTQPNAPGYGDSGVSVGWDDTWVGGVGHPNTNGDNLDGLWAQIVYPAEGWWDLGFATDRIVVFLSQDHGPYLAEGLETRVYGSNTLWGAVSSQAVLTDVYLDGWRSHNPAEDGNGNGWCSDDIAGVYKLPGMYRYVKIAAWSSVGTLNEPEVDAVAAFFEIGTSMHEILRKEWTFDMHWYAWGYFGASSGIADLGVNTVGGEPNSDLEIVTGSDETWGPYQDGVFSAGVWRTFDSGGNLEWQRGTQTDEARSSVAIVDLDGDGDLEIAGGTTSGWYFEVMDHQGNFVWTFPKLTGYYVGGPFVWPSSPAAADLDSSVSGLELVIGNQWLGNVWAFDGDNSDGVDDGVTIAYADYPWTYWNGTNWVSALTGTEGVDWDVLWKFPATGDLGGIFATPAIGDVDNDEDLEVVIGAPNGNVYVLDGATEALEHTFATGGPVYASAALANLDGDAFLEIVIGSTDGKIYCFQWNGAVGSSEWPAPYSTGGAVYSSAAIGDINNDGALEIVVGSNDNKVYALGGGGQYVWSFKTGSAVYSSPALAERCNVDPYDKDWPMFRNNPCRTGLYGTAPPTSLDVYVGSDDGYLYLIEGDDGTEIDRFRVNVGWYPWPQGGIHTSPVVADVDGDKYLEIFFYDWGQASAHGGHTYWALEDAIIRKEMTPTSGGLGTVVHITLHVGVPWQVTVKVTDTLPKQFTYIPGTFKVNGVSATPTVTLVGTPPGKNEQISYTITQLSHHKIEFDAKVGEAKSWEDWTVYNRAKVEWYKEEVMYHEKEVVEPFVIHAFSELHKNVGIPKADVVFSFDLTGSMSPHIAAAKSQATTILNDLQTLIADVAFGVVTHVDYPYYYSDYCGYSGQYGELDTDEDGIGDQYGIGDYAYKTDLDITTSAASAISTIAGLGIYWGADGPQDYSRVLYETQFLSWRPNAKKIVVLFGDNIPHDCDFWTYSTGGDPGRDAIANTADDLDFQTVVASLVSQDITVLAVDCSWDGWAATFYQYLADETGGQYFMLGETGIPEAIKETVKAEALETLTIKPATETQWAVVIDITNTFSYTMTDAKITDRFGAEIEIDEPFPVSITHGTVTYTTKGKSAKVFLTWEIGDLPPGETARLILLVSTDINPKGIQEYSESGIYELNSGATLKFIDSEQDVQLSAYTDSIYVTVLPA